VCLLTCMWPARLVSLPVASQSLVKTGHPSVFEALVYGLGPFSFLCLVCTCEPS
jgi:hypothetical protein